MKITRREFAIGTGAFAFAGIFATLPVRALLRPALVGTALADDSPADLMKPGPLDDMVLGDPKAPITIIEYASMTCPHCAHFSEATFPELKKRYIDTGKVRFIMREFPLDPLAAAGFMLARCAAQGPEKVRSAAGADPAKAPSDDAAKPSGESLSSTVAAQRYHAMVETLFAQQSAWVVQKPLQPLLGIAKQAGFTQESFESCLNDRKLQTDVEATRNYAAEKLGVNSTPTFFINGQKVNGAMSIEEMEKILTPMLKS